jgi:chemotaxis protein methyltransferase CheR
MRTVSIFGRNVPEAGFSVENIPSSRLPQRPERPLETILRQRIERLGLTSSVALRHYQTGLPYDPYLLDHFDQALLDRAATSEVEQLCQYVLPQLYATHGVGRIRPLRICCVAPPTSQDAVILAMILEEFASGHSPFCFYVHNIDLFDRVLEYECPIRLSTERIQGIPERFRSQYLLPDAGKTASWLVQPPLLKKIIPSHFDYLTTRLGIHPPIDILLFRNILPLLSLQLQNELLTSFCHRLPTGRFLCLGAGESLLGRNLPLTEVAPSIYRRE